MAVIPTPPFDGIGIANLPNQVSFLILMLLHGSDLLCPFKRHKIVAKRGAHFTIMVVGA